MDKIKLEIKLKKQRKDIEELEREKEALLEKAKELNNKESKLFAETIRVEQEITKIDDAELFVSKEDLKKAGIPVSEIQFTHLAILKNEDISWSNKIVKAFMKNNIDLECIEMHAEQVEGSRPFFVIFVNAENVKEIKTSNGESYRFTILKKPFFKKKEKKNIVVIDDKVKL